MKIQKEHQTKSKKALIICLIALIAVLLLVGAGVFYLVVLRKNDPSDQPIVTKPSTSQPSSQDKANQATEDTKNKQDFLNSSPDGATPPAETSSSADISMTISQSGDKVVVSTNLGYISDGTCKLTVGGYTSTVEILYQPSYSTCMGFSIDRGQLSAGDNTFKLDVVYDSTTLTKTETVNIK